MSTRITKPPERLLSISTVTRNVLNIVGVYSFVAPIWFLVLYSSDYGRALGEVLSSSWEVIILPVLPYMLFAVAFRFARVRWKQISLLVAVLISAASSLILYAGAFTPTEPEYGVVFSLLGVLQTFVAVVFIIIAL